MKIIPPKEELKKHIGALYLKDIAKCYNVSTPTIKSWFRQYNIIYERKTIWNTHKKYIHKQHNMLFIKDVYYCKDNSKYNRIMAQCVCDCGQNYNVRLDSIKNGYAFSCGCVRRNRINMTGSQNPAFNGFGDIRSVHIQGWKRTAKRTGRTWKLSKKFLWNLYLKQNKKCALSGIDIYFGRVHYKHETNASLDRIDSDKGYTEDNVQWVCKVINIMKKNYIEEDFIKLCNAVAKTHPRD